MSAQVANSWTKVTHLCARTVRSACAQTCPDFRVIIVCNEIPEIRFEHPNLEFMTIDFSPPGKATQERNKDKWRREFAGLRRSFTYHPSHVMMLNADDCVSKRLADHVARNQSANGWYLKKGYFHTDSQSLVHLERRRFHMWCGSSHILRPENMDLPEVYVETWCLLHRRTVALMHTRGTPIQPLPFPGAVYNVSHGENMYDYAPILWPGNPARRLARRVLFHRRLTPEIRAEFALYPLPTASESST